MLNEKDLRKPGFSAGHAIVLGDGQQWTFPKPRVIFKPVFVDGKVDISGGYTFGTDYDASMDVLLGIVDAEPVEVLRIKFEMAVRLLRANYELTDDDLSLLLAMEISPDSDDDRWSELSRVIRGISPKEHTSDG